MEQNPIFIPLDGIETFPEPAWTPSDAGRIDLEPKPLHGYRCKDIVSEYMWHPNGPGKGFTQQLLCRHDGPDPQFNYMRRQLQNHEPRFIVLQPRPQKPYVVVGTLAYDDIELEPKAVEYQTFVMQCVYCLNPFPFYDGPVNVTDVTVLELMDALFGMRDKED